MAAMVKKAMRTVDFPLDCRSEPWGTSGFGVFILFGARRLYFEVLCLLFLRRGFSSKNLEAKLKIFIFAQPRFIGSFQFRYFPLNSGGRCRRCHNGQCAPTGQPRPDTLHPGVDSLE